MTAQAAPRRPVKTVDVIVVSADPAGLVAALDCARLGLRVVVLELPDVPVPSATLDRLGTVTAVCDDAGVPYSVESPVPGEESFLGIPANPFARSVRLRLGWRGAWRAYLDRLRPVMRIGNERRLDRLVTKRLGSRAWTQLVEPAVRAACVDGALDNGGEVSDIAPGLVEAMSRVGSLTLAVVELMAADPRLVRTVNVAGGVAAMRAALRTRLDYFAARRLAVTVASVTPGAGGIVVTASIAGTKTPRLFTAPVLLIPPEMSVDSTLQDHEGLVIDRVGLSLATPTLDLAVAAAKTTSSAARRGLLLGR